MAGGQAAIEPPAGRDRGKRAQDEVAIAEPGMGDGQRPRPEAAAIPGDEVEIEHPLAPAPAGATAEIALDLL